MKNIKKNPNNYSSIISEDAFTLVELLFVVTIIALIAAIAIPQYTTYRQKAFDTTSLSDIRNLQMDMDAYFANYQKYPDTSNSGMMLKAGEFAGISGMTISPSSGVTVWFESSPTAYLGYAWHKSGSKLYGLNQKNQQIHVSSDINLRYGSLAEDLAVDQVWQAPWIPL